MRTRGRPPLLIPNTPPPAISSPVLNPRNIGIEGTLSIQVLRTYGRASRYSSYTWCDHGEYTVWASYLNAIKAARRFIYIEDQYLVPFGWPVWFEHPTDRTGHSVPENSRMTTLRQRSDIIYQLGQAICRGVKVAVVVPESIGDADPVVGRVWDFQRQVGAHYLASLALSPRARRNNGEFIYASLQVNNSSYFVHSKVMLCDDELVMIGTANINRRSMTHDTEIHLAIIDSVNEFALSTRRKLLSEHFDDDSLDNPGSVIDNPNEAFRMMKDQVGRIVVSTPGPPGLVPPGHQDIYNQIADPYAGPIEY
jgi:hypothetical protein